MSDENPLKITQTAAYVVLPSRERCFERLPLVRISTTVASVNWESDAVLQRGSTSTDDP